MVIKPWGYSIWEKMQRVLDDRFKETGHVNAYFPLLIPLSFLQKEASHVEGFAKECAVVTHHRLANNANNVLEPSGKLEEPLVIRPTSETIIGHFYAKWVHSYRDLPILMNQWANVMRWEMRPRIFLRTSEFLWQEGHTVHATKAEAIEETEKMIDVYADFVEDWMAVPVIKGKKTKDERFPGAEETLTIEAMMQDGKAVQAGTSHFFGQNFSKASDIKFLDKNGDTIFAWTTSWGVSTRLVGALIMAHSDDDGLVLPPKLSPKHVVLLPIYRNDEQRQKVLGACEKIKQTIEQKYFSHVKIACEIDNRDLRGGEKYWYHVKKGVPLRCEIGMRDLDQNSLTLSRRDSPSQDKESIAINDFIAAVDGLLTEIQDNLYQRAKEFSKKRIVPIDSLEKFEAYFTDDPKKSSSSRGFALCHWNEAAIDHPVLKKLKVTPRCIPLEENDLTGKFSTGTCIFSGKESQQRVVFAKAY
jgi:prolyl-tRNA synthetase